MRHATSNSPGRPRGIRRLCSHFEVNCSATKRTPSIDLPAALVRKTDRSTSQKNNLLTRWSFSNTCKKMALFGTFWHFLRGCPTPISFCKNNLGQIDPEFGAIFWHWPDSYED
jgi:hypothetical protein